MPEVWAFFYGKFAQIYKERGIRMEIYLIAGAALLIALLLMFFLGKHTKNSQKLLLVSLLSIVFIVVGITYAFLFLIKVDGEPVEISTIILTNIVVIATYLIGLLLVFKLNRQETIKKKMKVQKIAIQSILVGIASVLMLISFPVMPAAPYLKVELSALIIFMTLIWFDFKTAVLVSFITNIVHFFLPSSAPIIPFLDEMINFLATMLFILPTAMFFKKEKIQEKNSALYIFFLTGLGFLTTVVLMVLFNQFINLPYIYRINMTFTQVLTIFGVFNIIKWGLNAIFINLTWKRFYYLNERFSTTV
jgi:riboflavin transporter